MVKWYVIKPSTRMRLWDRVKPSINTSLNSPEYRKDRWWRQGRQRWQRGYNLKDKQDGRDRICVLLLLSVYVKISRVFFGIMKRDSYIVMKLYLDLNKIKLDQ